MIESKEESHDVRFELVVEDLGCLLFFLIFFNLHWVH